MSCLLSLNFTLLSPVCFGTSPFLCFKLLCCFFVFLFFLLVALNLREEHRLILSIRLKAFCVVGIMSCYFECAMKLKCMKIISF